MVYVLFFFALIQVCSCVSGSVGFSADVSFDPIHIRSDSVFVSESKRVYVLKDSVLSLRPKQDAVSMVSVHTGDVLQSLGVWDGWQQVCLDGFVYYLQDSVISDTFVRVPDTVDVVKADVFDDDLIVNVNPDVDSAGAAVSKSDVPEVHADVDLIIGDASGITIEDVPSAASSWNGSVLTKSKGVNMGPSGKETYYNLPMAGVVSIMRSMGNHDDYWVREDGVKMLGSHVMVAANLSVHPRGSLVETSLGMGIVCDTGGFVAGNPNQLDIAVNW